jgi:hypothetical protein
MVQAASYPPLQRTQGRGTQSSGTGKVKGETETRATRLAQLKNYGLGNSPHKNEMIRQGMQYKRNDCGTL